MKMPALQLRFGAKQRFRALPPSTIKWPILGACAREVWRLGTRIREEELWVIAEKP